MKSATFLFKDISNMNLLTIRLALKFLNMINTLIYLAENLSYSKAILWNKILKFCYSFWICYAAQRYPAVDFTLGLLCSEIHNKL